MATNLVKILSIDGGGIRGVIPGQILVRLEELTGQPIYESFDMIAGTSTGGILACALLCPADPANPAAGAKFSAQEAADLYLERGDEIFERKIFKRIFSLGGLTDEKYNEAELEDALQDYLGDIWLRELLKPCLITAYDVRRRRPHFFNQYNAAKASDDFLLRDVARATSAAPTFFEAVRVKSRSTVPYPLIDGGVFANNPAMCAYAEARGMEFGEGLANPTARNMLIVSLGTGSKKKSYSYSEVKDWGVAGWVRPLVDILMSGNSDTVDFQLEQIYDAINKPKQYLRIDPELGDASTDMDDASDDNLVALREAGIAAAETYDKELKAVAKLLTT